MKSHFASHVALSLFIATGAYAIPAFAQTGQDNPRQRALVLEQRGQFADAASAWTALAQAQPTNPEPLAHLGLLEARQEHYSAAIRYYRKSLTLAPGNAALEMNLGLALFKNGDFRPAIQTFTPLLKSQPADEANVQRLSILIGMAHYGLGEYVKATPYLKQASEHDAQNLELLLALAHSCLLSDQYPCVLDAFHRIVALNAESAEADMLVGEALSEMKDTYGAIREFRAAAAANPREPNVHFGLGYLLWTERQYPEAAKEFQAEIDNDPQHMQARLYLGNAYIELNRMEEALPLLEQVVKNLPNDSMGHFNLGIVYAETDRKPEALVQFQTAARLTPSDAGVHFRLARLYRAMGKTAEAKAEFDKTRNLNKAANTSLLKMMSGLPGKQPAPQQGPISNP